MRADPDSLAIPNSSPSRAPAHARSLTGEFSSLSSLLQLPAAVVRALSMGHEALAVRLAIFFGQRDANKLTNMVFFARYPKRQGRKLQPGEPGFQRLSREWLTIRDELVRPALAGRSAPPSPPASPPKAGGTTDSSPGMLSELRGLGGASTAPTVANALRILQLMCAFHSIPWRVAYVILEHEGGVRKFRHGDGVMQTIARARKHVIPRIPRPIKLAALGKPATDSTPDSELNRELHGAFGRSLAVQIATGVQELKDNLDRFSGYVALAYQAYNAGAGWALYTVTGKLPPSPRPASISEQEWEGMCRRGAARLHQSPQAVSPQQGMWQCDENLRPSPGWHVHIPVIDPQTGRSLVAYKYLRSIRQCVHERRPSKPCTAANHKERLPGSGRVTCQKPSRVGSLDKLYDPGKLDRRYRQGDAASLSPIADDGLPLRVLNGKLAKMSLSSPSGGQTGPR